MIIGDITVYKCDDETCDKVKVVHTPEDEAAFRRDWFVGLTRHFCLGHKESVRNASVVHAEEEQLERIKNEILFKIDASRPKEVLHAGN